MKGVFTTTGQLHVTIHSDCDNMHKATKVQSDLTCHGGDKLAQNSAFKVLFAFADCWEWESQL